MKSHRWQVLVSLTVHNAMVNVAWPWVKLITTITNRRPKQEQHIEVTCTQ